MADNEPTDERNGVSRANERAIRAIVRDELRVGEGDERDGGVTRREVLEAAGLVGVGALGGGAAINSAVGTAEAATGTGTLGTTINPLDTVYANQVGGSTEPVQSLYTEQLSGGVASTPITNFEGTNLSIDGSGNLNAAGGGGGSGANHDLGQMTNYPDGLSNQEIARFDLDTGETLEVHELQVRLSGGGTDANFSADVYDETNATVLASTSDVIRGSPTATSGSGATVLVRVTNSTGGAQDAAIDHDLRVI